MKEMAQMRKRKIAIVQCLGGCTSQAADMEDKTRLAGGDCMQRLEEEKGGTVCHWGCSGGGTCVAVCRRDAIHINGRGTAEVEPEKCVGCGLCAKACPRGLIRITDAQYNIYPACVSRDEGAQTRQICGAGCIACGICVRNCPVEAVSIVENHAVIDEEKCIACGMCAVKCPRGVIRDYNGIFTIREVQVGV